MSLDNITLREVVDLLTPHCGSPDERRALFAMALGLGHPLLRQVDFQGKTDIFIINAVEPLLNADAEPGKTALWAVLEVVAERVGEWDKGRIRNLYSQVNINRGGAKVFPPSPIRASVGNQIETLVQQLEMAEAKGGWRIVIDIGERVLALDAEHEAAKRKLVYAYLRQSRLHSDAMQFELAIDHLSRAIKLDPFQKAFYYERAMAYRAQRSFDLSIADFIRAVQLDPNEAGYHFGLALSCYEKGDYQNAFTACTHAIQLDSAKSSYFYTLGVIQHARKAYDQAVEAFTQAVKLDPYNARIYSQRGVSYHEKRDYKRAIQDHNRAIQLEPNNSAYYYARGAAHEMKGDRRAARTNFKRAAELGHDKAREALRKYE